MALVTLPDNGFRNAQWTLNQPTQVNKSEWTNRRQVMQLPGAAFWTVSADHVPIIREAAFRPWRSFLAGMRGQVNTTRLIAVEEAQHGGANPVVTSGVAGGFSVGLSGMPVSAQFLPDGAFMTITYADGREQLVVVRGNVMANESGLGAAIVEPMLLASLSGATVETRLPWARIAFNASAQPYSVDAGQIYSIKIEGTETF